MNSPLPQSQPPDSVWYGWILKLFHHWKVGERQVTYVWAVLVGMVGSCMSLFFEWMVEVIQWMLTGIWSDSRVGTFSLVEPEWRMFIPVAGGLVAGCILLFLKKRMPGQATEYMEAMSIGNGLIKFRASALKVFSAAWSIASGAAIGKEGPIIQSSALIASTVGQRLHVSIPRLRLLVGCGAAAGFTTAFHAPFSGCLFVSEIIIGTVSMDILAPLLIASCTGFVMLHLLGDPSPLYSSPFESFTVFSQSLWCIALGAAAAVAARGWVSLLDAAARYLNGRQSLLPLRLAAAGLVVGILAVFYPEVVGNGQALITGLVHEDYGTREALVLLLVKVSAVAVVFGCRIFIDFAHTPEALAKALEALRPMTPGRIIAVFGCGTVGGAMTPTLYVGSMVGFIFSTVLTSLGMEGNHTVAYAMVGMASFFAVAAQAPLTALVMVVEFSMSGQMIYPLLIGVVSAYGTGKLIRARSMYAASLAGSPASVVSLPMAQVHVHDLARHVVPQVAPDASLDDVSSLMLRNPGDLVFVVNKDGTYEGAIYPEDFLAVRRQMEERKGAAPADAGSLVRTGAPVLDAGTHLTDALKLFEQTHLPAFPVVWKNTGRLDGVLYRNALFQVITEMMKRESGGDVGM